MVFSPSYFDEERWQNLSRIARNVLLYLFARANGNGECYPSLTRIGKDLLHNRNNTSKVIGELERENWITREIKNGVSTLYKIQPVSKTIPVSIETTTRIYPVTQPVSTQIHKQNYNKSITQNSAIQQKAIEVIRFFNTTCKTTYRENSKEFLKNVIARINDGYTVEDFKKIVLFKFNQWNEDPKMKEYIRPSTLFRASHFEEYLQDATKATQPQQKKVAL